jgi:ribosomal protein S18 acetylase RimI-like enzyme
MINLVRTNNIEQYKIIENLAFIIWREHYTPIIGKMQVDYMLKKFQSIKSIKEQVEKGYDYYIIYYQETAVGYFSFIIEENYLFLSKIYLLINYRGKKIGKKALLFIDAQANEFGCDKAKLTVNKYNIESIKFYEKSGFKNMGSIVQDIGGGYIMDDYQFQKNY